jgi:hypothetical protein
LFLGLNGLKSPFMPRRKHDWEAIKAMFIAGRTANEIGHIFHMHPQQILNHSQTEGWGALRKQLRSLPPKGSVGLDAKMQKLSGAQATEVLCELEPTKTKPTAFSPDLPGDAFSRALRLRSSDNFRERVINQADKALTALENSVMNNVYETDRFAEALTKVERIGARAYGYDHESDHPIINIGILGSGAEYETTN